MATLTQAQRVALKTWTPAHLRAFWAAARKSNPNLPAIPPGGFVPNVGGFSPFAAPERPPPGTYDPAIDAQVRASGRGYGDLQQDTSIANTRAQDDFLLGQGELQRSLDRALADAKTTRTGQHEDYTRAVGDLTQSYGRLGATQADRANAAGVLPGSGALQQALEKRTANFAHDRVPLDTGEARAQSQYDLMTGPSGRLQEDFQSRLGELGLGLTRGNEDRGNALSRAGRENDQLGLDAASQRWYQSAQAGYDPPTMPAGEHVDAHGRHSRLVRTPRGTRRLYSTGQLVMR